MSLKIVVKNYRCFSLKSPLEILLQQGNSIAFTGVNNVGKSVPLKFFWEFRNLFDYLSKAENWTTIYSGAEISMSFNGVRDDSEVFNNFNDHKMILDFSFVCDLNKGEIRKLTIEISRHQKNRGCVFKFIAEGSDNYSQKEVFHSVENDEKAFVVKGKVPEREMFYPILNYSHAIKAFREIHNAVYVGAFRNTINNTNVPYFDLKVGTDFIKQWADWQNGYVRANQQKILELTTEISDLLELPDLRIQSSVDNGTLNITYSNKVFRLEELGAGIAQVIIILGNIMIKKPSLVLIDEPEMNLHPRLQVRFLALIEKYSDYLIYSTHSIGLSRSFSDRVFLLKKENGNEISQVDLTKPNSCLEFAGELYYGAVSQIGCNKVLLCEGPTELKIIQHFLRKLGKANEFLLIPLYGRNQINAASFDYLEEITKLGIPVFVLIDSEKNSSNAPLEDMRQKFAENCSKLSITCKILERRAIENYFTAEAIQKTFGPEYRALKHFESLASLGSQSWNKNVNWKIASNMDFSDLNDNDLGKFLLEISQE